MLKILRVLCVFRESSGRCEEDDCVTGGRVPDHPKRESKSASTFYNFPKCPPSNHANTHYTLIFNLI